MRKYIPSAKVINFILVLGALFLALYALYLYRQNTSLQSRIKEGTPVVTTANTPSLSPSVSPSPPPFTYIAPSQWKQYNKTFQNVLFYFSYPPRAVILDTDESSGNIYINMPENRSLSAIEIGRLSFFGLSEYQSGGRREWFINAMKDYDRGTLWKSSDLSFTPLEFSSGNSFYLVRFNNVKYQLFRLDNKSDFYFGILGGKAVMVIDQRILPKRDVYTIMQSLVVK